MFLISKEYDESKGERGVKLFYKNMKELKKDFPNANKHLYETKPEYKERQKVDPKKRYQPYSRIDGVWYRITNAEVPDQLVEDHARETEHYEVDVDLELAKAQKSKQKAWDKTRVANKIIREQNRLMNASEELLQEVLNRIPLIEDFDYIKNTSVSTKLITKAVLVQVTDIHVNEIVKLADTLGVNEYTYEIASAVMKKYALEIKEREGDSVQSLIVALTGDLLNSDRRLDELLTNAGNRSEALIFAVQVIIGFLLDLAEDYELSVVSVYGNESRLDEDIPVSCPTNNFDFLIHKFAQMMLVNYADRITFLEAPRSWETVINILGANVLLTHGHTRPTFEKEVFKYTQAGIILHYMITGHCHHTVIKDNSSQSGSTVGGNFYSNNHLHTIGRKSQTIYEFKLEEGSTLPSITAIAIDLQNVDGIQGYYYDKDVCKNGMRKSPKKRSGRKVIVEVIS